MVLVVDDGGEYGNMVAIGLIVVVGRYIILTNGT